MDEPVGKWSQRLAISSTVKEGYRVGDASVSFTDFEGNTSPLPRKEIRNRLYQLVKDGEKVAERLNEEKATATADA